MTSYDACNLKEKDKLQGLSFSLSSPSKINLFFRVLSKRSDGFHEIASLYQAVRLFDTITFSLSSSPTFTCSDPSLAMDEGNLCVKAYRLFEKKTGYDLSYSIHLDKRVPMQAGLGGGSGNAATILWGLNKLTGSLHSDEELALWSSEIGSDVSFFFSRGAAYCTGRGEILAQVDEMPHLGPITIVKPHVGLSTPGVYKACKLSEMSDIDPAVLLCSYQSMSPIFHNDLEFPSFSLLPSLKELKAVLLSAGFSTVLMCGSGTAFFCLGEGIIPSLPMCKVFTAQAAFRSKQCWYE